MPSRKVVQPKNYLSRQHHKCLLDVIEIEIFHRLEFFSLCNEIVKVTGSLIAICLNLHCGLIYLLMLNEALGRTNLK